MSGKYTTKTWANYSQVNLGMAHWSRPVWGDPTIHGGACAYGTQLGDPRSRGVSYLGGGEVSHEKNPGLEDHPRTCKWLVSPLFTSHEKAIYKGNNTI